MMSEGKLAARFHVVKHRGKHIAATGIAASGAVGWIFIGATGRLHQPSALFIGSVPTTYSLPFAKDAN